MASFTNWPSATSVVIGANVVVLFGASASCVIQLECAATSFKNWFARRINQAPDHTLDSLGQERLQNALLVEYKAAECTSHSTTQFVLGLTPRRPLNPKTGQCGSPMGNHGSGWLQQLLRRRMYW